MNLLTSYLIAACSLFHGADIAKRLPRVDVMQAGEWLLIDTLDLQLSGPYYDASFYHDDIVFLKPGEESLYLTPIERPDPAQSRPLFANTDIRSSPAALSFTGDYRTGFYTRSIVENEQVFMEKIFELSMEEDQASLVGQLPFTTDPYRYLHPAVSPDGSTMIFASDRLPTRGGLDLYITERTDKGWSEPRNLGETVNTSGHEWFPFLDKMNNLWFTSSGHSGYGGFDIYVCPYQDQGWGAPRNLGNEINGPQNEWGFSIHPEKQLALFSRSWTGESKGSALLLILNEEALKDISPYLQERADPPGASNIQDPPEPEAVISSQPEPVVIIDPADPVVFRVQIISSLYEKSFPTVFIDGKSYSTFEYFYLGSYRITVGKFDSLEEANAFRLRCLESGFKQAFVAAFRGDKRETDPSVFKQ